MKYVEAFPETLADAFPQPYRLVAVGATELDVVMTSAGSRVPPVVVVPAVPSEEAAESEVDKELRLDPVCGDLKQVQEDGMWPRVVRRDSLLTVAPAVALKEYDVSYEEDDGGKGFLEVDAVVDLTAQNSTSLQRAPAGRDEFVRGSRKNVLFLPGGMSEKDHDERRHQASVAMTISKGVDVADLSQFASDMSTVVRFEADGRLAEPTQEELEEASTTLSSAHNRANFLTSTANRSDKKNQDTVVATKKAQGVSVEEYTAAFNVKPSALVIQDEDGSKKQAKEEHLGGFVDPLTMVDNKEDDEVFKSEPKRAAVTAAAPAAAAAVAVAAAPPTKPVEWAVMDRIDVTNFRELVPNMAIEYPFELDTFQKEAIVHLERRECVFVAAHTSAGKTVVAEYAIALSKKHLTRTIYTSPIKALSNQKYRDFQKTFGDVGLITGDVQLNPEGSVLIMTTEILRSMLYRGADLIRDVEFLIFDECHYVSDRDRGVVWEEVIILVPSHVSLIFLSATVPNTYDFADWVGRVKRKKIHVISTMKRPTPLEHYLWAGKELHKIVDSEGKFLRQAYENANEAIKKSQEKKGTKKQQTMKQKLDKGNKQQMTRSQKVGSELSQTHSLVKHLKEGDLLPVVIFVYSKKQCENSGFGMQHMDLSTASEKSRIRSFFDSSVARLNSSDRKLPQILRIKELLSRGIGVHHGGILPLVREIIEILFSKGLVKVLFATETFAMGLNMPARSVVFNSLRKHDGTGFRDLLPGEFLQAAGRAGRRGIDKVGTVIVACWHEVPDVSLIKGLVVGKAERLESQFRLTYNQILNLLRVEDFDPFDMMSRSFSESVSQKKVPEQKAVLLHAQAQLDAAPKKIDSCLYDTPEEIEEYYKAVSRLRIAEQEIMRQTLERHGSALLQPGRVIVLKREGGVLAVVLQGKQAESRLIKSFALSGSEEGKVDIAGGSVIDVDPLWDISGITETNKLDVDIAGIVLGKRAAMTAAAKTLRECRDTLLDPVADLKMNSIDFFTLNQERDLMRRAMEASACHGCEKREQHFGLVEHREKLVQTVASLKAALSRDNLYLLPEFNARLKVLEKLEYIDSANVILIKGRVAREINSCDELIATEMIFEGVLSDLDSSEAIALLSMLVFEENIDVKPNLTERLSSSKEAVEKVAHSLAKVQAAAGLDISEAEYLKTLKPGLMEVVYEWANGRSFGEIMTITEVQEGSIVRNIVRLEETCREFRSVARVIGDQKLYEKMEMASQQIKRDIVFCSSLYLTPTGEQEAPKEV